MGVLQRLSICYLSVVILSKIKSFRQWLVMILIAAIWITLTYALSVPNCPTGYLGPGGISNFSNQFDCIGGSATYIDKLILGKNHMYKWTVARQVFYPDEMSNNLPVKDFKIFQYSCWTQKNLIKVPFEPEGLLGTLNAIITCFIGFKMATRKSWKLILLAYLSSMIIPINKQLWTLSFSLVSAATAQLAVQLTPKLQFLISCGKNSMLLYIGHTVLRGRLPFQWSTNDRNQLYLQHCFTLLFWCFVAKKCNDRKLYLTV